MNTGLARTFTHSLMHRAAVANPGIRALLLFFHACFLSILLSACSSPASSLPTPMPTPAQLQRVEQAILSVQRQIDTWHSKQVALAQEIVELEKTGSPEVLRTKLQTYQAQNQAVQLLERKIINLELARATLQAQEALGEIEGVTEQTKEVDKLLKEVLEIDPSSLSEQVEIVDETALLTEIRGIAESGLLQATSTPALQAQDAASGIPDVALELHYQKGVAHLEAAQWELAKAELEQVLTIHPNYKDASVLLIEMPYRRGIAHIENKKWEEAQQELEQVYAMDPSYKDVTQKLAEVSVKIEEQIRKQAVWRDRWRVAGGVLRWIGIVFLLLGGLGSAISDKDAAWPMLIFSWVAAGLLWFFTR